MYYYYYFVNWPFKLLFQKSSILSVFTLPKCARLFTQLTVNEKSQNLRRLQAQRNELNAKGKTLLAHIWINIILRCSNAYLNSIFCECQPDVLTESVLFQCVSCVRSFSCCRNRALMWERWWEPWTRRKCWSRFDRHLFQIGLSGLSAVLFFNCIFILVLRCIQKGSL